MTFSFVSVCRCSLGYTQFGWRASVKHLNGVQGREGGVSGTIER